MYGDRLTAGELPGVSTVSFTAAIRPDLVVSFGGEPRVDIAVANPSRADQMNRIPFPAAIVVAACQAGAVTKQDTAVVAESADVAAVSVIRTATMLNCGDHEANLSYQGDSVVAIIDGTRILLQRAPGDSVVRYVASGDSGTVLTRTDTATTIRLRAEDLPPCVEQSAHPFVARGHEPGWIVRIIGETITYIGSYGADTVSAPIAAVSTTGSVTTYTAPSNAKLTVVVRDEPCGDGATGMPHPYAVTVTHETTTVSGCGGEPSSMLVGQEWVVSDVGGTVITQSPPTMIFMRSGRVGGSTSCNRYSGPYRLSGEGLRFGAMISTKMACAAPRMSQETAFLQLLGQVTRFEIAADGALRLLADDGGAIVARRK